MPTIIAEVIDSIANPAAMQAIANAYSDEVLEKAYKMSSCANSDQRWQETMRCHAFVLENQLCTRVNTVQSFQEANRLLPHNLALFDLQPQSNITTLSRNKVYDYCWYLMSELLI